MSLLLTPGTKDDLTREVADLCEQNLYACYQCGKCSATCPLSFAMGILPHQVLRLLQLGHGERLVASQAPWVCVGCMSCAALCPKGLDLSRIMEALRTVRMRRLESPLRTTQRDGKWLATLPQSAVVAAMRKVSR
ncbi:MAG: 4Fe-4S dicluster domain-containing protein [Actinomycetota bacterium]|jgi:heterodisulfide reductase subunit C